MAVSHLQTLRQILIQQELDAILISQQENRRYLSGFTGSTGWLLISKQNVCMAVDFRYVEQARRESPDLEIVTIKGDLTKWLPQLASDLGLKKLGFESKQISFSVYSQLCETLADKQYQLQLIPTNDLVESMRITKEPWELETIIEAVELSDSAFEYVNSIIQPGDTEKAIAWRLEKYLRENGSESMPFDIIVASGPNSALPHAKPSERAILECEPILIDMGARVNGYCSDLSRTLYLGKTDETFSKVYDIVLGAQLTALATIEAGMNGDQADRLSRTVIEQADYGEAFGHSLGHGIGLAAHEAPYLATGSSDVLLDEMVFTVEPGIYIPGWGGVRIEDTVVMEKGKSKTLSKAEKAMSICGR